MAKAYKLGNAQETLVIVHCPGCGMDHPFRVKGDRPKWEWNGSLDSPTFSPSLLVFKSVPERRCHSFVEGGRIRFLGDCHHELKNKTVALPDLDSDHEPILDPA